MSCNIGIADVSAMRDASFARERLQKQIDANRRAIALLKKSQKSKK